MGKLKRLMVAALSGLMALTCFAACGNVKRDYDLKVSVYLGEYGQIWINTLAAKFEEEFNVKVKVEANPNLQSVISNRLQNGKDDDLFFSHGIPWEQKVAQKQVANLDDLYEMEVEDGVKFKDRVNPDFLETAKFRDGFWKVPWTNGAGGLIYNKKMFDDNKWPIPTVYSNPDNVACVETKPVGLTELCAKIYGAGMKPFVWSSETYYWDYVVFDWWMQLMGEEKMNAYKKSDSPDLFNPEMHPEQKQALQAWYDLIVAHPEYSVDDSVGKKYSAAQMEFVTGNAAMIPNAQWLEMGMNGKYDENVCEMAIMPTPMMNGAKTDAEGNPIRVNYAVGAGDSIIIPASAPNKPLAKQFLLFMARKENIKLFTEKTMGVMLAMDYTGIEPDEDARPFLKSVFDINKNSVKFNLYSQSNMVLGGKISLDWPAEGTQHYASLFSDKTKTPDSVISDAYTYIATNWARWLGEL